MLITITAVDICITFAQFKEGLSLMLNINSGKKLLNNLKLLKLLQFLVLLFFLNLSPLMTPIVNAGSIAQAKTTQIMSASIPERIQVANAETVMGSPSCTICHMGWNYKQVASDNSSSFLSDHFLVAGRMKSNFLPVLSASSSETISTFLMTL